MPTWVQIVAVSYGFVLLSSIAWRLKEISERLGVIEVNTRRY